MAFPLVTLKPVQDSDRVMHLPVLAILTTAPRPWTQPNALLDTASLALERTLYTRVKNIAEQQHVATYCKKSLRTLMKAPGPPSSASSVTRASVC